MSLPAQSRILAMSRQAQSQMMGAVRAWGADREHRRAALRWLAAVILVAPALWHLALLVDLYRTRASYPFDVEWLEGSALYQAYRHMKGLSTYAPPSNGYLPLFHPPGYPILLAGVGRVFGLDYGVARTVSFACFAIACVLIMVALCAHEKREDRVHGVTAGLFAAGLAAAATPLFEGFYDLVREDGMSWMLCIAAAVAANVPKRPTPARLLVITWLCTAALYTRLVTVFLIAWIHLYLLARNRRAGVQLALYTTAACGLVLAGLEWLSGGWYWVYTVGLLREHAIIPAQLVVGAKAALASAPYLYGAGALFVALVVTRRITHLTVLWVGMWIAAAPAALLPFAKTGGFVNDLMPFAMLSGAAALFVVADAVRAIGRSPRVALGLRYALFAAVAGFLASTRWDDARARYTPTPNDWLAARHLDDFVKGLKGGFIAPHHPFLAVRHGVTTPQFSDMPVLDAYWSNMPGLSIGSYLDQGHPRWALMTGGEQGLSLAEMASRFQFHSWLNDMPAMLVGEQSRFHVLLKWQESGPNQHVLFDFENRSLDGWKRTGEAFSVTAAAPEWQAPLHGVVGSYAVNSYAPAHGGDAARGALVSPPFVIDREVLAFRIGGGTYVAVQLWVEDAPSYQQQPIFGDQELLFKVEWDVREYRGKKAVVRLVDDDVRVWGHLLCDHFELYDRIVD